MSQFNLTQKNIWLQVVEETEEEAATAEKHDCKYVPTSQDLSENLLPQISHEKSDLWLKLTVV